jgi:hypothetical protein
MTGSSCDYFARDYFNARARFLDRAKQRGARTARFVVAATGPSNELLSIDTAYLGAARPQQLLIVTSGTHGAEGFAGSAIQQRWLDVSDLALPGDAGVLLVHAVNPFGFAWIRRTNENNVDLNRNALERFPGPANPAYAQLNRWLNPTSTGLDFFWPMALGQLLRMGLAHLKQAIAGGQYDHPRGIFYGGNEPQESITHLQSILSASDFSDVERVLSVDIHTGLGRYATYKVLVDFPEGSPPFRKLEQWYGTDYVNGSRPEKSVSYQVSGGITGLVERCFPAANVFPSVLEFGTVPLPAMIARLRDENRAYFHCPRNSREYERARMRLLAAFCPTDPGWRNRILEQGVRVLRQAQRALADPLGA